MRVSRKLKSWVRSLREGQGFGLVTVVCVAVITATALWARRSPAPEALPAVTPPAWDSPAASLWQQSLADASTPAPEPSAAPRWIPPLPEYAVLQPYAADVMVRCGVTGLWATHPAVDLAAEEDQPILAMANGTVCAIGEDMVGWWITLSHEDGYATRYAGLQKTEDLAPGDSVQQGDTIGYAGSILLADAGLSAHLRLQAFLNSEPLDPLSLLE